MKVKQVMNKEVISIKPEDNAKDALNLILKIQISGLPVIDSEGKLRGMFTEKDILSYLLPSYIRNVGKFIYKENPKSVQKKFFELDNLQVQQLMRKDKDVATISEEVTLCEAARLMLTSGARRLPVVDCSGKVVGIVARCDLLKALASETDTSNQVAK